MCGEFFDSKRKLGEHIDRHHRITNSKMKARGRKEEWLTTIKEEEEQNRQLEEGIAKKTRKKKREKWLFLSVHFYSSVLLASEAPSL